MAHDVSVPLSDLQQLDRLLAQARLTIRQLSQREEAQEAARRRFVEFVEETQEAFSDMSTQEKADLVDEAIRYARTHP